MLRQVQRRVKRRGPSNPLFTSITGRRPRRLHPSRQREVAVSLDLTALKPVLEDDFACLALYSRLTSLMASEAELSVLLPLLFSSGLGPFAVLP